MSPATVFDSTHRELPPQKLPSRGVQGLYWSPSCGPGVPTWLTLVISLRPLEGKLYMQPTPPPESLCQHRLPGGALGPGKPRASHRAGRARGLEVPSREPGKGQIFLANV